MKHSLLSSSSRRAELFETAPAEAQGRAGEAVSASTVSSEDDVTDLDLSLWLSHVPKDPIDDLETKDLEPEALHGAQKASPERVLGDLSVDPYGDTVIRWRSPLLRDSEELCSENTPQGGTTPSDGEDSLEGATPCRRDGSHDGEGRPSSSAPKLRERDMERGRAFHGGRSFLCLARATAFGLSWLTMMLVSSHAW